MKLVIETPKGNRPELTAKIGAALGHRVERDDIGQGKCAFDITTMTAAQKTELTAALKGVTHEFIDAE